MAYFCLIFLFEGGGAIAPFPQPPLNPPPNCRVPNTVEEQIQSSFMFYATRPKTV